jgi:hypothetical protein
MHINIETAGPEGGFSKIPEKMIITLFATLLI